MLDPLQWDLATGAHLSERPGAQSAQKPDRQLDLACAALAWGLAGRFRASLLALMLSGALGIALGDSFYFAALRRLGTRRLDA